VSPARASLFLLVIIYLGYISLGLPDGTLGIAWPEMHTSLGLPIGMAGAIMIVVTILAATSGFSSGGVVARFSTGPVVFGSCFLTASGLMIIAHAQNLAWLLVAAIPLGLGAGAVDAGANGFVARHYSGRHMNWLHACWGIGASCGPLVMGRAITIGAGWRGGFFTLACVQLFLAILFLLTLPLWKRVPERKRVADCTHRARRVPIMLANSPAGWLSVTIFGLYVAVETTTGLWAGSILVVSRGISLEHAAVCVAAFYGSITGGRILVGFVVERWGNRRLVAFGTALAILGAIAFAFAFTAPLAGLALVLLGLGFAPIYPCLMHEVPQRFAPDAVQTVIGRQSGAGSIGAGALPAAAGTLAQFSLESISWVVIAGVVVMLTAIRRLDRLT
jgi:fucose permease